MRDIFLDRDGVINENSHKHVKNWEEFVFLPNVLKTLRWLHLAGFRVFVVTNQAIVSRGQATHATIEDIHTRMIAQVEMHGGSITDVRYCPHDNHEQCACRKPHPGMLFDLAQQWQIDLSRAYLVGDALTDIAAARSAGCRAVLVRTGRGAQQIHRPEIKLHQPDYIVPDLMGAVQWVFRQEWLPLPDTETELLQREIGYSSQPALVRPGV
ncbi:MAG: D-glycero-alpha-D-manno-heptose-1,7-bisphosphate 7-phosphatase [Chloroflexaceae bacterium]